MRKTLPLIVGASIVATSAVVLVATVGSAPPPPAKPTLAQPLFNDSHVHLTNYIQEGVDIRTLLRVMGDKVGRATLFGIPLQQMWSYRMSADDAPTYYLDSDSELYYYSFTDAHIALQYKSLTDDERARFDPMITGFNPADMYAADHVRRVLETFPDTFVGIGEFSLHKEFVTSKLAGEAPALDDPALDRLFRFAAEVGLVVLVHCDIDTPFPRAGEEPAYLEPLVDLFERHPNTTFIWAHVGLGRVVRPVANQAMFVERILENPKLRHVNFDISWNETAKYLMSTPTTTALVAQLLTRFPDRFLFGTDEVAPKDERDYLRVYRQYQALWDQLPVEAADKIRRGNYTRLFDQARAKVRLWQEQHKTRMQLLDRS
jgi:hypothetical protein